MTPTIVSRVARFESRPPNPRPTLFVRIMAGGVFVVVGRLPNHRVTSFSVRRPDLRGQDGGDPRDQGLAQSECAAPGVPIVRVARRFLGRPEERVCPSQDGTATGVAVGRL